MLTNGRKKVEKAMSLKKEAKAARVKASGTKKINVRKQSIVQKLFKPCRP
jgi:hypothetical protein